MKDNNQLKNNNSFLGFTDNRTALQAGKIEKCLAKVFNYDGIIMERRDAVLLALRNGGEPEIEEKDVNGKVRKSYRIYSMLDESRVFTEITKTEYDFCMYLLRNDLISEENVNAYIEKEKGNQKEEEKAQEQALETAKKEEEEQEKKAEEFDSWLKEETSKYIGTDKGNLMERIFIDKYGDFSNPIACLAILTCIDNIDDNPLCREELKSRLHTDNAASRKTFECVTGLKLPKNNRDTKAFLDNLKKSDYKEMIEYKNRKKVKDRGNDKLEEFYILEFDPNDKNKKPQYRKIMAERVVKKGFECFIHEMPDGKYGISSARCGMRLAVGRTKPEAVKELKRTINKVGDVKLRKNIEKVVKAYGENPLYKTA